MTPCVKINATTHATAAKLFVTWDQGPYRPSRPGVCHTICMSYATDILEPSRLNFSDGRMVPPKAINAINPSRRL